MVDINANVAAVAVVDLRMKRLAVLAVLLEAGPNKKMDAAVVAVVETKEAVVVDYNIVDIVNDFDANIDSYCIVAMYCNEFEEVEEPASNAYLLDSPLLTNCECPDCSFDMNNLQFRYYY